MPRLWYESHKFGPASQEVIRQANQIITEYQAAGFDLTLRQLYYQFVARALIPNTDRSYKRLGSIVNDARMAGLIDWYAVIDRTRYLRAPSYWDDPAAIIDSAARSYSIDKWEAQPFYVETWIEKDALVGVIQGVCDRLAVPYFSCRGYPSQSEVWRAAQRIGKKIAAGKTVRILHLGDHDPSGIDMTRDIEDRIRHFLWVDAIREETGDDDDPDAVKRAAAAWSARLEDDFQVDRLGLNFAQVLQYDPPPNPAKITDSRAKGYIATHGDESWELDALEPQVLADLIDDAVLELRDEEAWAEDVDREETERERLTRAAAKWHEVVAMLDAEEDA